MNISFLTGIMPACVVPGCENYDWLLKEEFDPFICFRRDSFFKAVAGKNQKQRFARKCTI